MNEKSKRSPEKIIKEIKRKTRRKFSSEEKIRIVIEGLRGEDSIAAICRREANTAEVCKLKRENTDLKMLVAELVLEPDSSD